MFLKDLNLELLESFIITIFIAACFCIKGISLLWISTDKISFD